MRHSVITLLKVKAYFFGNVLQAMLRHLREHCLRKHARAKHGTAWESKLVACQFFLQHVHVKLSIVRDKRFAVDFFLNQRPQLVKIRRILHHLFCDTMQSRIFFVEMQNTGTDHTVKSINNLSVFHCNQSDGARAFVPPVCCLKINGYIFHA